MSWGSGGTCNGGRDVHKEQGVSPQKFMSSNLGYSEVRTNFGLSCKSTKTKLNSLVSYISPLVSSTDEIIPYLTGISSMKKVKFGGHVR